MPWLRCLVLRLRLARCQGLLLQLRRRAAVPLVVRLQQVRPLALRLDLRLVLRLVLPARLACWRWWLLRLRRAAAPLWREAVAWQARLWRVARHLGWLSQSPPS
jgi:hypothetical protein